MVYKADVGVCVEGNVAKWLDLQAQASTNNDVLELEKETAGARPDASVGQLTLTWEFHVYESVHCGTIVKATNKMQVYRFIYYS